MEINNPKSSIKWPIKTLSEIVELAYGQNLPKEKRTAGKYEVYGSNGIVGSHDQYLVSGPGIIVGRKGSIGKVIFTDNNFWPIDTTYYIKPIDELDLKWFYYRLQTLKLDKLNSATGVPGLNRNDVYSKKILFPTLKSQQKIVSILSSIDEEIYKTDQIIQKTEKLKSGLINELLTKGIGHTKFQKTKIGEIPEDWSIELLSSTDIKIIDGDRGTNYPRKDEFQNSGYCLFLTTKNIVNDTFNFKEPIFISEEKDKLLRKGKLQKQDVILTTRGTVGNVAFFDDSVPYQNIRINSGMLIFRAGNSFDPQFLYFLMKSPLMKKTYSDLGSGSAQPQLPISSLKNLQIAVPTIKEQKQIASKLQLLDNKYNNEKDYKKYLLNLKNGLMNDIFSQKVEVN